MSEEIGPPSGSTVYFVNPASDVSEPALITSRFENGEVQMATLSFEDGSFLDVAISEVGN